MILPQLGRNPQQFDDVYNASVRAHDRDLGACIVLNHPKQKTAYEIA